MTECCAANEFSGCCEGIECREQTRRKEERQNLKRILAKRNADTFMMMTGVAFSFALVAVSFYQFAIPESKRMALRDQESTYVVSR